MVSVVLFAFLLLGQTHPSVATGPEADLVEVQSLVDAGKLNDAESGARRYLETHQGSADAHFLLGYILFREGNPKLSLAEYKEGARYRAPGALDLEAMGGDDFLLEDYAAADQWLTKSVELAPGCAHPKYYLGRVKYNQKRFADALRIFTECLNLDPRNAKAANYLGLSYEALGR